MVRFRSAQHFSKETQKIFLEQKKRILKLLPKAKISHIGSTAIPNALTKGDLDILVMVPRKGFRVAVKNLKKIYRTNQLNNWDKDFASFKDDRSFNLKFGAQLIPSDAKKYDFLRHVNLFRRKPELLRKYNQIKRTYEGKSMRDYRKAKEAFLKSLK